jgi:hypothetical protein
MMNTAHVFVTYTRRDGHVSGELLERLHDYLAAFCTPFVHAVEASELTHQQVGVIRALVRSDLVIVIESPLVYRSPWVIFELLLCRLRLTPLIKLQVSDLNRLFR